MLLGNYNVLAKSAGRFLSGGATGLGMDRSDFGKRGPARNRYQVLDPYTAHPLGTMPGNAIVPAQKSGGIGSRYDANGVTSVSGSITEGRSIEGATAGAASATATGQLVVSGSGAAAGSSTASATILAALLASGTSAGVAAASGTIQAKASVSGAAAGETVAAATISAVGHMQGSVTVGAAAELTAPGIAAEILDEQLIETGLTVRETLRLCAAAMAGKVFGAAGSTITIRNAVADNANRIVATVDASGNRTAITYDLG